MILLENYELRMLLPASRSLFRKTACLTIFLLMLVAFSPKGTFANGNPNASVQDGTTPAEPATELSFEVATIRPVDPKVGHVVGVNVYPGGRVVLNSLSFKTMLCVAFNLSYWQLSGGQKWMDKISYDVQAIPPQALESSISAQHTLFGIEDERLRKMLQRLLADRFKLKFHREERMGKVYLLERAGKRLALQPSPTAEGAEYETNPHRGSIGFAERWVLRDTTMPQLSKFASDYMLHCPVLDRTKLNVAFDYTSQPEDWNTYQQDPTGSFLNLVRDLGLKLKAARGPVSILVIDYADEPSPN